MSNEMRAVVREVAKYFPTTVISGMNRDKVKEFLQLSNVYYAGSHGMDIMVPPKPVKPCDSKNHTTASALDKNLILQGSGALFQPAKRFLPAIQEISILLEEKARKTEGARVEDNKFYISIHYRKVLEMRPSIEWNKGHALQYLLDTRGFNNAGRGLSYFETIMTHFTNR